MDRRAGGFAETSGSDRGFRRRGEGYGTGSEYFGRTDAGLPAERQAVGPRSAVWGCFRLFAHAGETVGAAGRLLLSLEVSTGTKVPEIDAGKQVPASPLAQNPLNLRRL